MGIIHVHTSLQVINNTNTDIIKISVWSVDSFDWMSNCRPDLIFNGVSIGAKRSEEGQLIMNRVASNCPFNMTLLFRNGNIDTFRIHQKYVVGCCSGFEHMQRSHDISYVKRDDKLIINIENTKEQLQNEQAEKLNKEGIVAMEEKQYETAIKTLEEALKLAHETFTINSIMNNTTEAYMKQGKSLLEKGWQLEADKDRDKSLEAHYLFLKAESLFAYAGILKPTSEQRQNLSHASIKVEGNELFNKAIEVEKLAFEAFESARKSNEHNDYKAAGNKYKEALNMYKAAKNTFDAGSKIDTVKFGACLQIIDDHIKDVMRVLNDINEIVFINNMDKVTIEERKREEMDSQDGINMKLQQQVDVTVNGK
jgi:tetratricopeptide (TPR) repeat protein